MATFFLYFLVFCLLAACASDEQSLGSEDQGGPKIGEATLTADEVDALRRQVGGCWRLPSGIKNAEDMVVQLRVLVRPDRTVEAITVIDQARLEYDPRFRAVAESARRAIDKCGHLNLPPGKYDVWREIEMNFYPEDAARPF